MAKLIECPTCEKVIKEEEIRICDACSKEFCNACVIEFPEGEQECPNCNTLIP